MEFAISLENLDIGHAVKLGFPIGSLNKWLGAFLPDESSWTSESQSAKSVTDAEINYPKAFIGVYLNYIFAGY